MPSRRVRDVATGGRDVDQETREEVRRLLGKLAADVEPSPTFVTLIDGYLRTVEQGPSIKSYRSRSKPLNLHFGATPANQITLSQAADYRTKRTAGEYGNKVSAFQAEMELDFAKWVLNWAVDEKQVEFNPLARLKKKKFKNTPQGSLREEHLPLVVAAAPNLVTAVYLIVCFDTGLRRTEALSVLWSDIDWAELSITVRHGKGDKERVVTTTARALEAIRRLPRVLGNQHVFANPRSKRRRHYCSEVMNDWVRDAVRASGVEQFYGGRKVRIHGLRRGHATNAAERGIDLRCIQEQLGHSSISTTEKYLDSRLDHRRREMRQKFDRNLADPFGERRGPHQAPSSDAEENQDHSEKIL
jgi:integrase